MAQHCKMDCLVKRLDCSVVVKVKVTEKVQNSSECSSGWYLLSCWTLCNQTWYSDGDACTIMGQSVMQEDWFAVFKFRITARGHLIRYDCFYHICWTAGLFATKFNWTVHHHQSAEAFCIKIWLLFSRSRPHWRFKTLLNLYYVSYAFCTTDLFATKVGVLIYYS